MSEATTPAVSIVIPVYNRADLVVRAIRSVLNQTLVDFEIVVVDDGSTDNTATAVESIDDKRIRLVRKSNGGVSSARNTGIQNARSELIAFLDSDDEWDSAFLETILRLRRNYPQCSAFATRYIFRSEEGQSETPTLYGLPKGEDWEGVLKNYFEMAVRSRPPICTSAVAVTKQALHDVGGFPTEVTVGEDLITWARIAAGSSIAYSSRPLVTYWHETFDFAQRRRRPDASTLVADELKRLRKTAPADLRPSLRQYLGLWHKIRAWQYLNLGERGPAFRETLRGLRYCPTNWKLYGYLLVAICPAPVQTMARRVYARLHPQTLRV